MSLKVGVPCALMFLFASAACGGSPSAGRSTTSTSRLVARTAEQAIHDPTEAGLRAAAIAYATAFLTGTARDLIAIGDPRCVPMHGPAFAAGLARANGDLRRFRFDVRQHTGTDARHIQIQSVDVRHYHTTAGQAETQYGLPIAIEGNDNWNSFTYSAGQWHLAGCNVNLPMGGQSPSAAAAPTAPS